MIPDVSTVSELAVTRHRLQQKGGKLHEMPAHHLLESYIDAYVTAAGIGTEKTAPLFRTLGGRGRKQLGTKRMTGQDARRMIVRRAVKAGIITRLGCHTFRATGITVYLLNGVSVAARRPELAR
jgi:integrase/recombinase XerD